MEEQAQKTGASGSPAAAPEGAGAATGGSYEILLQRLRQQSLRLAERTDALNGQRKAVFGGDELSVLESQRLRTENNCVPRDIVSLGDYLLFGYNVYIGLKSETAIDDVFSVHRRADFSVADSAAVEFLHDATFAREFKELYQYYKEARLIQLRVREGKLLAVFQIGAAQDDIKVFRWRFDGQSPPAYIDNRGERDHVFPPSHDFEWVETTRDDRIEGRHPHVSILDRVFVETVGGDLTIKVENNTEDGQGIYAEPVDDARQSLDDAKIAYARVGELVLLRVLPFGEQSWRYFAFCSRDQSVERLDAIGQSCIQLPEDHGVIFPGGYVLQTGERKTFDGDTAGLRFLRAIRSPNGEDILYVFHQPAEGRYVLLPYNLIRKEVQTPNRCHGYSLFDDGKMVVFRVNSDEPTRVHPIQVWQTPFCSAEHTAATTADRDSYLAKVGNAELVRGISDAYSLCRLVDSSAESRAVYEGLITTVTKMGDAYYWLGHQEVGDLLTVVQAIGETADAIVEEFDKVVTLRRRAEEAVSAAQQRLAEFEEVLRGGTPTSLDAFMSALTELRSQRGQAIGLHELRFVEHKKVESLEASIVSRYDGISEACFSFLCGDDAFVPLTDQLAALDGEVQQAETTGALAELRSRLDEIAEGLDALSEIASGLQIGDANARAAILERVSEVVGQLNRLRAVQDNRRRDLLSSEGQAEFAAQFKLLSQAVDGALARSEDEAACDEQLSQVMVRLEEIEGQFSEFDDFVAELAGKREEIYDAFAARKQTLVEQRQRRAEHLFVAAERILAGVARRAAALDSEEALNAYFAADPMLLKLRELSERLRELGDNVKADDLDSRLKAAKQSSARTLRDRSELFEGGSDVIRLGRHRFSVSHQGLELTMVPREAAMSFHLTGTGFYQPVTDEAFLATQPLWQQSLVSENAEVCRAEYLAFGLLRRALDGEGSSLAELVEAERSEGGLLELVRQEMRDRYDEGYERGIHDADASAILSQLIALYQSAGLLRFSGRERAAAQLGWCGVAEGDRQLWSSRSTSLARLRQRYGQSDAVARMALEASRSIAEVCQRYERLDLAPWAIERAGRYLIEELIAAPEGPVFVTRTPAAALRDHLFSALEADGAGARQDFVHELRQMQSLQRAFALALAWFEAHATSSVGQDADEDTQIEAATLVVSELVPNEGLAHRVSAARASTQVVGLVSQHPRIQSGTMQLRLDEALRRLSHFEHETVPAYRAYRRLRHDLLETQRETLRLAEYKAKVLTSFVRNRLINEVYLPMIGDNLAKQLGAVGAQKRTDLMGLLLLVSPPGYGKTTLMEYIASQLGLVFVKVNGPSLGHSVTSIDPAEAPSATARQEVQKINFAFELGSNVMLYLDDIQHTHPELLQKFISLCDAQRRIEGVWQGRTRTYDLRGKRFCMVMAGNPYTESGEKFQIPDMLANRADTYNLGDVLTGKDEVFALSYLENSLTSNATLAPLASRGLDDLYTFVKMAQGQDVPASALSHDYTAAETSDIVSTVKHLCAARDVLLRVNRQYIDSAAQDDAYRTEPRFQLQGSYRNMNKLAERIAPAMNDEELQQLIDDHYVSEAQTLTSGAEHNLLKLAELRGRISTDDAARWQAIKNEFCRQNKLGGRDDDPVVRVVNQLSEIGERLGGIARVASDYGKRSDAPGATGDLSGALSEVTQAVRRLSQPQLDVKVETQVPEAWSRLFEQQRVLAERTLYPLVENLSRNLSQGQELRDQMTALFDELREVDQRLRDASFFMQQGSQPGEP